MGSETAFSSVEKVHGLAEEKQRVWLRYLEEYSWGEGFLAQNEDLKHELEVAHRSKIGRELASCSNAIARERLA